MNKGGFPRKNGEDKAQKIRGVFGVSLGGLAALEEFRNLGEFGVGVADLCDAGVAGLDETQEWSFLSVYGKEGFDDGLGLVLFRRINLCEARAEDVSLPEFIVASKQILFDSIVNKPDFGPVIMRVTDEDDFEERLVGLEFDLVVKLRDERAELLEVGDADCLEVRFAGIGRAIDVLGRQTNVRDVAVEADGARLRGNLPL